MVKFKEYIKESERTEKVSFQYLLDILETHCKKNLKHTMNGKVLYRGTRGYSEFLFGDSNKGKPRTSANTYNYYTLLIDNSKLWKDYPKRSRSFICSTYKAVYGDTTYVVIPYDNTWMGVCPSRDMWDGFETIGISNLDNFNTDLNELFNLSDNINITWSALKKGIDNKNFHPEKLDNKNSYIDKLFYDFNKIADKTKFIDYWEKLFDPRKNGFRIINSLGAISTEREIWFSGKAVFLNENLFRTETSIRDTLAEILEGNSPKIIKNDLF